MSPSKMAARDQLLLEISVSATERTDLRDSRNSENEDAGAVKNQACEFWARAHLSYPGEP
jgi:hypothetical protein